MTDEEKLEAVRAEIEKRIMAYEKSITNENHKEMMTCLSVLANLKFFIEDLEPKESEDERIRKKFINALKECGFTHFNEEFTVQEALDWLEKQGEQKPVWSEEDEICLNDALHAIEQARAIAKTLVKDENDIVNFWRAEMWLESIKQRMKGE